ncbi:Putative motility protein [Thermosyntropha lipolytica DSM 11003]|uniref:Putative motility protein n=1 Tax=Thermosyntropha lipolytica DSM 11003 TaxID=1123382 RepID=A0A1M5KMW6_9FIRM|nr:YjfB family protein [Thermosyntropha lipolytica]SHG54154.1 Putative motility protein [Thermosyntropha lipolytica DSM 11003]
MDIAAWSISFHQAELMQKAGVSVLKMAMEQAQVQMDGVLEVMAASVKAMEQSVMPHLGAHIDIRI